MESYRPPVCNRNNLQVAVMISNVMRGINKWPRQKAAAASCLERLSWMIDTAEHFEFRSNDKLGTEGMLAELWN